MEKEPTYRAILFDLGWTLIYPSPTRNEVVLDTLEQHGYQVSSRSYQKGYHTAKDYYQVHRWRHRTIQALGNFWASYYRILLASFEEPIFDEALVSEIERNVRIERRYRLYPETIPVLTELRRLGYIIGAVSNWNEDLPKICERLGLTPFFEVLVVSDIVGWHKPQPQIFELALRKMNVSAEATIHVGDDYEADVLGARDAGMTAVLLDRNRTIPNINGLRIGSVWELIPVLETMGKSGNL